MYDRRRCGDYGLPESPTLHGFNVTTPHTWLHPPHTVGVCILFIVPTVCPALHVHTGIEHDREETTHCSHFKINERKPGGWCSPAVPYCVYRGSWKAIVGCWVFLVCLFMDLMVGWKRTAWSKVLMCARLLSGVSRLYVDTQRHSGPRRNC